MPFFSIIIPTYNRASIISQSLHSIERQTFADWECIVVDDFSTDNTREVVLKFCKKDNRFHYLINEQKKGAQGARNTGIKHANGCYISFLDSDDTWHPDMLENQLNKYQSDEEISCVYSKLQTVHIDGSSNAWDIFSGLEGYIYEKVLEQGYMSPTITLSAKRICFDEIGSFDVSFPASQDDDMCFRLAKKYKVGYIPKILADVKVFSKNRISNDSSKVAMGWWMLWNKYESDVVDLCGKEVMAKHYRECLHSFIQANEARMTWKVYRKYSQFGGKLPKRKRLWLITYCLFGSKCKYFTNKIQNKL